MIYLSQRDLRWSLFKLGASNLTVGAYGCTTTCISMLSDYFECYRSPADIAKVKTNYTKDGLVLWQKLAFDKMRFVSRVYTPDYNAIDEALANKDKAVILQVNNGKHWVVAVGNKGLKKGDYYIADPWTGRKYALRTIYPNITGAAFFERIKK